MSLDWNAELVEQIDTHWWRQLRPRLDGLTDEEYFWQPVPGCWTISRRGESSAPMSVGAGEFTFDYGRAEQSPAPVTTIAWRLAHIIVGFAETNGSHFGVRSPALRPSRTRVRQRRPFSNSTPHTRCGSRVCAVSVWKDSCDRRVRASRPSSPMRRWRNSSSIPALRSFTTAPRSACCAICTGRRMPTFSDPEASALEEMATSAVAMDPKAVGRCGRGQAVASASAGCWGFAGSPPGCATHPAAPRRCRSGPRALPRGRS